MLISRYNLHTHLSLCHSFPVSYYESINTDVSGRVGWVTRGGGARGHRAKLPGAHTGQGIGQGIGQGTSNPGKSSADSPRHHQTLLLYTRIQ
jgi:hypothetical protein